MSRLVCGPASPGPPEISEPVDEHAQQLQKSRVHSRAPKFPRAATRLQTSRCALFVIFVIFVSFVVISLTNAFD